jgi:hypothetical protein
VAFALADNASAVTPLTAVPSSAVLQFADAGTGIPAYGFANAAFSAACPPDGGCGPNLEPGDWDSSSVSDCGSEEFEPADPPEQYNFSEAPPAYFRWVSGFSRMLVLLLSVLWSTLQSLVEFVFEFPIDVLACYVHHMVPAVTPRPFDGYRTAPRIRKKNMRHWYSGLCHRLSHRLPPTSSQRRLWTRYTLNCQYDSAITRQASTIRWALTGGKGFMLILMVVCVLSCLGPVVATKEALLGFQACTGNLALWELSHVAGWKFLRRCCIQAWRRRPAVPCQAITCCNCRCRFAGRKRRRSSSRGA